MDSGRLPDIAADRRLRSFTFSVIDLVSTKRPISLTRSGSLAKLPEPSRIIRSRLVSAANRLSSMALLLTANTFLTALLCTACLIGSNSASGASLSSQSCRSGIDLGMDLAGPRRVSVPGDKTRSGHFRFQHFKLFLIENVWKQAFPITHQMFFIAGSDKGQTCAYIYRPTQARA